MSQIGNYTIKLEPIKVKFIWYVWIYNSIIFPHTYFKMKKIINNMNDIDKAVELAMFEPYDYWFNRLITKMWIKKVAEIDL